MNKQTDIIQPARKSPPAEAQSNGELVPIATGSLKLRLPYPKMAEQYFGIDARMWGVLIDAIYPGAKTVEGICLALSYCKSRNLDIMKRPIHIVPISVKSGMDERTGKYIYKEVESVWPGICEIRITASRTNQYAGKDAAEFGPDITKTFQHIDDRNDAVKGEKVVTFPEWCRVTVYKLVQGVRCAFVGPKVFWEESYSTESRFSQIPNEMWCDRRSGQLEKCAEAASLRAAFPEELGNEYVAEEMAGKVIDSTAEIVHQPAQLIPPRPVKSEFERPARTKKAEPEPKPEPVARVEAPKPDPVTAEPKLEPEPVSEVETETPGEDAGEPSTDLAAADFENWYAEQKEYLGTILKVRDVADLRQATNAQIDGYPDKLKEFGALCDKRTREILDATKKPGKK